MRARKLLLPAGFIVLALTLAASEALSQFPGGKGGKWGGGSKWGGKGGGFGRGGGGMKSDPGKIFDWLSRGKSYVMISDMRFGRDDMMDYAKRNNITNGQLTRDQYIAYSKEREAKGGGWGRRGPGGPGGAPPSDELVEIDFKRRDKNGDGRLNKDEMPDSLKAELSRWDTSKDDLIDLNEYKSFFTARFAGEKKGPGGPRDSHESNAAIIISLEELDRRPVTFRAGNLPSDIPSWFKEYDIDKDGQVSLFEWRKGGKDLDDFKTYDHNDDGLLAPEEVLRQVRIASGISADNPLSNSASSEGSSSQKFGGMRRPGSGGGGWGSRPGGGSSRMGGMWGMKRKK